MAKGLVTLVLIVLLAVGAFYHQKWKAGGVVPPHLFKQTLLGKTILITGANTGIGLETAVELAKLGATIIVGCRDEQRAKKAVQIIQQRANHTRIFYPGVTLDLSSLTSVRDFAKAVKQKYKIHTLINNAGVMMCPHALTTDGYEIQFGTNHLGHFLLTKIFLRDILMLKGRVINVSSRAHTRISTLSVLKNFTVAHEELTPEEIYGQSKIANILFTRELQKRFPKLITYSLHPGFVATELMRHFHPALFKIMQTIGPYLTKNPLEGAQTTIFAMLVDPKQVPSGSYLSDCGITLEHPAAQVSCLQNELWEQSEEAVKAFL
jgi:NAD(P)-dependent dehydrogenase (short-subunit alcohol dehydrogenase family)